MQGKFSCNVCCQYPSSVLGMGFVGVGENKSVVMEGRLRGVRHLSWGKRLRAKARFGTWGNCAQMKLDYWLFRYAQSE